MTGIDLLRGTRVVDLAGDAAAYTGRMFADLGADVVLVEPPGGSASRQVPAHFAFMHAGKRSVTTDLAQTRGRELFSRLVTTSDVLVTTAAVGDMEALDLGYETLHRLVPRLVYTSVTPFGLTGPRRRWRGSDLVGWAASGALPSIGDPDRAPLAPGGGLAFMTGALNAAMGTLAALTARRRSGTGQLVDISLQEAVISVAMESGPMTVLEAGFTQTRTGKRRSGAPIGHYATRDGAVSVVAYMPDHWRSLAEWIRDETGVEEVTADVFAGPPMARMHYGELIDSWIEGLTVRYTKQEFFEEAQRRGITVAPVNAALDVLHDPQLQATGGWQTPEPAGPRFPTPPVSIDGVRSQTGAVPRR